MKNVIILAGGISNEREVSLMTAREIAKYLPKEKFRTSIVELSEKNIRDGSVLNQKTFEKADCVFLALHGKFGEDGIVQGMLDVLEIPYTGSGVLASALAMDKIKCQEFVAKHGIRVPASIALYDTATMAVEVEENIRAHVGFPCIVKPNASGSSIGISMVGSVSELAPALQKAFAEDSVVLVQQYIHGREFSCGVLGNAHITELVALPVIEIIPHESNFFDYQTKYFSETTEEICPAKIPDAIANGIQRLSRDIHNLLGCRGLTRSDFMLSEKNELYFLEINTIPGQTQASLVPKEARAAGMTFAELLEKQIELALSKG